MTPPPATADKSLRFDRFEISAAERVLRIDGRVAPLGARAFDLLLALAERRHRLVSRQELLELVWPGVVVEEHNITAQISSLRKLLGPQVIATVPGRGYRFVAPSAAAPGGEVGADSAAERSPRPSLPEPRTRFIGREAALADLTRLLGESRLLTLTGIGGSGKTRLALELARQRQADFADGVCFVDLAPLDDPPRVVSICAAALGLGSEREPPQRVVDHLAGRRVLLVLDNCEQVRAGAASLADALLARPGASRIVATSREPLSVAGEQLYPVPALSLPATAELPAVRSAESVRVFVDRARLARPDFEVDADNAAAVVDICRRLDGHALAIELAAARVTMLPVADIAARLVDRFRLLTGGPDAPARQRTLAATLQWSHDLLAPAEQRLLRRLAVFAGGCTLPAAAAVGELDDDYQALALLTALHDKSLLEVDRRDSGEARRYRMLDTVHHYAQQRLDESGEVAAVRERHAEHFLALAESAAPHLRGPQQSSWMARLAAEHENLVAALAWWAREPADPQRGLRLMAASGRYWLFHDVELGCRLAEAALQHDRDGSDSPARLQTLLILSAMHMHRGQGEAGLPHARAALASAQQMGSLEWQAVALNAVGTCLGRADQEQALRHHEQARDLAQAGGHAAPLGAALNNIACIDFRCGRLESAARGYRQALHLSRAQGDVRSTLIELHNLVRVLVAAGRHDDAGACAAEAERLLRGVAESALKLELLEVCAGLASSRGEHPIAARWWGCALHRFAQAGYQRPPEDEAQLERWSALTRQMLGAAAFEAGQAAGRVLDLDAAIGELRNWLGHGA